MYRNESEDWGCWLWEERQTAQGCREPATNPPRTKPWEPSQPGARWVRGPCSSVSLAAPLATLLHLRFRCSHLVVQISVLGHFTYDSLGILSYTNTIPMLTNCLWVIPTREICGRTRHILLSLILLEGRTEIGFKLRKKFHS